MKDTQMRCAGGTRQAACWLQGQPAPFTPLPSTPSFAPTPCTGVRVCLESQSYEQNLGTLRSAVREDDWLGTQAMIAMITALSYCLARAFRGSPQRPSLVYPPDWGLQQRSRSLWGRRQLA